MQNWAKLLEDFSNFMDVFSYVLADFSIFLGPQSKSLLHFLGGVVVGGVDGV
jgi:hypothetical protein